MSQKSDIPEYVHMEMESNQKQLSTFCYHNSESCKTSCPYFKRAVYDVVEAHCLKGGVNV